MTAGLSHHCQQVIACCHLAVKGFLFERKTHCVSTQVMRLFMNSNTKVRNHSQSQTNAPISHTRWLVAFSRRAGICADAFFLALYPWDNLYCQCCQDYCPTKDKHTDRPVSVQSAEGAGLPWMAFSYHHRSPGGLDAGFPFWVGSGHSRKLKICPPLPVLDYGALIFCMINGTLLCYS